MQVRSDNNGVNDDYVDHYGVSDDDDDDDDDDDSYDNSEDIYLSIKHAFIHFIQLFMHKYQHI